MFSIDKRSGKNRIMKNPGPYEAIVTSHLDGKYSGTLEVELLRSNDPGNETDAVNQRVQVRYLNPFYGVTNYDGVTKNNDYASSQQSYGMWFIPPDLGNTVLVIFVEGNINKGYWFGCVQAENQNFMIPDGRAATTYTDITDNEDLAGKKLPVGEYNKELLENLKNLTDSTKNLKPINQQFVDILNNQGLLEDETRGLTTSSARREAPSMVFGVSTPGPLDKRGNARGKGGRYYSRLGGSSIVMDDGDDKFLRKTSAAEGPSDYVNKITADEEETADETIPHNELVRIRTRTGHQILLHNSEDLIYIGNAKGTTWIELTANGKIDVYAKDSISFHTEADFNFKADRDVNIEAGRNVNIKSALNTNIESTELSLKANSNGYITVGSQLHENIGTDYFFTLGGDSHTVKADGKTDHVTPSSRSGSTSATNAISVSNLTTFVLPETESIMKRVPQHEPWPQHENLNPNNVSSDLTDRENPDNIIDSSLTQIKDTFTKN
jgi:hypothetical protein